MPVTTTNRGIETNNGRGATTYSRLALVLILALPGCAALGIGTSTLDKAAVGQNLANVSQLAAENEVYLAADATKAESLKATMRDRNAAAVGLARKMVDAAR